MIEPQHPKLAVSRQCALVGISRSAFYTPGKGKSPLNLALMRLIDAQFLETPRYGSRQMARHLRRHAHVVGRKRVRRLMAKMGLAWRLSNTMDADFCIEAVQEALARYGAPETFNTD